MEYTRTPTLAGLAALLLILGTQGQTAASLPSCTAPSETGDVPMATVVFMADTHDCTGDHLTNVAARIRTETGIDLLIHGGDVGDEGCRTYGTRWDAPFADLPWPVAAVSGNHDDPECFADRFGSLPRTVSVRSVDFFLIPWASVLQGEHLRWLDRETARSTAEVKVLVIHKAPWHTSQGADRVRVPSDEVRAVLRRINLVLAGHDHVFWDSTHDVDGHAVRQVIEMTGDDFYPCVDDAAGCVTRSAGYSVIEIHGPDDLRVSRRTF